MTFGAYIERQKRLIKNIGNNKVEATEIKFSLSDELFFELTSLKGLNTREREYYARLYKKEKEATAQLA